MDQSSVVVDDVSTDARAMIKAQKRREEEMRAFLSEQADKQARATKWAMWAAIAAAVGTIVQAVASVVQIAK